MAQVVWLQVEPEDEAAKQQAEWRRTYVWSGNYRSGVISCVMASLGVRTFGDIEQFSWQDLRIAGLEPGEASMVSNLMIKRGLHLRLEVMSDR